MPVPGRKSGPLDGSSVVEARPRSLGPRTPRGGWGCVLMGSAAQRAGHPARRQEQRREPLLCRVRPGAGPSLSEGRGVPSALGASQLMSSVRWGSAACHGPGRCPRGGGSKVALCRRKGVPLLRPSPNPSSLPFHGTRTSPEPVAPGAGFLAVGERRRGGLSENPALEASSSQARPRKALTPSLTRRAPVRGGRPAGRVRRLPHGGA